MTGRPHTALQLIQAGSLDAIARDYPTATVIAWYGLPGGPIVRLPEGAEVWVRPDGHLERFAKAPA